MPQPLGYGLMVDGLTGKKTERDCFTCAHCNTVVFIKPLASPSEMGGWCMKEAKAICGPCADDGRCRPFEKQIEAMEARGRLLTSLG